MRKCIVFLNILFLVFFVGTFWVLAQQTDQAIYNQVDNTASGAMQIQVVGRGITSPNLTSKATVETLLNTWHNVSAGAIQAYIDSSSGDIPFTNLSSLTNGDLLRYQSSDDSWVNTEGRVTLLDDTFDFAPSSDTTTCFQVNDADGGTPILSVDCTNERIGIGTASPGDPLSLSRGDSSGITMTIANADDSWTLGMNSAESFFISSQSGGRLLTAYKTSTNLGLGTSVPISTFEVDGSVGHDVTTVVASTHNIAVNEHTLMVSYTDTGPAALTLPSAASAWNSTDNIGVRYFIKDLDCNASVNAITISRNGTPGTDTITTTTEGNTSVSITTDGGGIWIQAVSSSEWAVF